MSSAPGAIPPAGDSGSVPPTPGGHHPFSPLGYEAAGGQIETDSQARTLGMLCHLLVFSGLLIPFGNFIGPLIVWLIKKDQMPFVNDQGKESLNFQISLFLACIACFMLMFLIIGVFLLPIVLIAGLVLVILATIAASNGKYYRYPCTLRLIK